MKRTNFYSLLRSVVVVDKGSVGHYCLAPTDPYLGLAGIKGKEINTPTVIVDGASEESPTAPSPLYSNLKDVPCEEKRRVYLHAPLQTINSSSTEDPLVRAPGSRLFAINLRLRVTQIVAGIVMILLGAVACLETSVRSTLGVGIPAGVLTVVASIANIQAGRRFLATNASILQAPGNINFSWNTQIPGGGALRNFRPFLPTLACVLANLPLLALSCMAIVSPDRNKFILGWLLGASSILVISTEASVWLLRYRYIPRATSS